MVSEVMVHPISELIQHIKPLVIGKTPNGPIFAIPKTATVSMSPSPYENFCKYLKMAALKTYVRYRLDGKSENDSMLLMLKSMKDPEKIDGKNLHRGRELIRGSSGFESSNNILLLATVADAIWSLRMAISLGWITHLGLDIIRDRVKKKFPS